MAPRRALAALLAVLAGLNLAVFFIRIVWLSQHAATLPLPGDSISAYALWRLRHGHAIYEWLTRPYFSFAPYNFLFYPLYSWFIDAFRVPDEQILWVARLPTPLFAMLGAWAQYRVTAFVAVRSYGRHERTLTMLLAFSTWLGCGVVSWWGLSIRPDVAAAALATAGLSACVIGAESRRAALDATAGVAFAAAWAFKQSYVMFCAAAIVHAALRRRSAKTLALLGAPLVLTAACALAFGSGPYRFDVFVAQTLDAIHPYDVQFWVRGDVLPNLLVWGIPIWSLVADSRGSRPGALDVIVLAAIFSGTWTLLTIGKAGSSNNYLIEPSAAFSVWCGIALSGYASRGGRESARALKAAAWMAVPMILFPVGLLIRGEYALSHAIGLRARSETLTLGRRGELERRRALASRIAQLAAPVYIDDEPLSLPWHTNHNEYPALVIDHVLYDPAERKGLVVGGLAGLVRERYFASLLLSKDSTLVPIAIASGYRRIEDIAAPVDGVLDIYLR